MIIDIGIILILIMFGVVGLKQGIIKAGISLIGLIIIYVISFALKGVVGNLLCKYLPFFDLEGNYHGLTSINILIYQLIGFILIFAILLSVYMIILNLAKILDLAAKLTIVLIIPLKLLGGLLGLIEGYIIVFICLVLLMVPLHNAEMFTESKMVNHIVYNSPLLTKYISPVTDTLQESFEIGEEISKDKITKKKANKKILDIMIKNKIVSKDLVDELIKSGKLKM